MQRTKIRRLNYLSAIKILFIVIAAALPVDRLLAHTADCNTNPNTFSGVIRYDVNPTNTYCELCGLGWVTIIVTNPSHTDMSNFSVVHDFLASNLEYVPGTTLANGVPVANPVITVAGRVLTWSPAQISALTLLSGTPVFSHSYNTITIRFRVRSRAGTEETLTTVSRNVQASTTYRYCPAGTNQAGFATSQSILPIREPIPSVTKTGRNVDASQTGYTTSIIYGNIGDDVIWRIRITNSGLAAMQDLTFNDLMSGGKFQINYACPSAGQANNIANNNGVIPGGSTCIGAGNTINNFRVDDPFGTPGNDEPGAYVDAPANGSTDIYLAGKILESCNANVTNRADGIQWGCEVRPPDGGISLTSTGASGGSSTRTLSSRVVNNNVVITRALTGLNTAQPVGARGLMTVTINNVSGGSIKNINLRNLLPPEYVVDSTFTPTITVTPAFGNYAGMVDRITWINPAPGTFPLTTTNPASPLANTDPRFDLWSSTVHPNYPAQRDMLRHGDVAVVRFRVVMIPTAFYDKNADLDVREEVIADTTDPNNNRTITNRLYVDFEQFCNPGVTQQPSAFPYTDNFPSAPEDIDIDITGSELIFILTNDPNQRLPLQVSLTNRGGHYAEDYHAFVSFGATMEVVSSPANCQLTTNPPFLEVWDTPVDIPASATVYQCSNREFGADTNLGTIAPGQTRLLNFEVIKTTVPSRLALDDLSFRADVVGEITLSNGTPLWFPAPSISPIVNRANNYSLDGIRARVMGFNLIKTQIGTCTENNPPPASPDSMVQIGEECSVRINTGGWFGFQTPGFTYIAVQRIQVNDELPNGQAYISSTDPALSSHPTILGINLNPPALAPLDEGTFNWTFNQVVPAQRITIRDQWFQADATTRLLNDPIDSSAIPNLHSALSRNILTSTFQAVFDNAGVEEVFTLGPSTVGYPSELIRRVDLRVTEPSISVTKVVCNETLYGTGTGCTNFVALADDGDTQDAYIYSVTLSNQSAAASYTRAPAYDIISRDTLDSSDLVRVVPFESDGLDNDADGLIDAADLNGEGTISDNIINNATPAIITFSHTHSSGLLRINPGASITFYYRVDPDDAIAPLQQLVNTVRVSYDSLAGASGNQTVVLSANSTLGGARVYNATPASATVRILPLQTQPKTIIRLSNTPISGTQPQSVSVGEEIEYRFRTFLPVANLRDFFIRDELPAGISCSEAPAINLNAAPYNAAGFSPGGTFTPTCTNNLVQWSFGNQQLTTAPSNNLFPFEVAFIARVDNSAGVNNGNIISNGVPSTIAFVSYRNEANIQITQNFASTDVRVREPTIALTKTYESVINDASDIITVTVTATNTGTAAAYNLRVLDDLIAVSNLTYLGNVGGLDPPDNVDTATLGINRPIFSWNIANPRYAIPVGASRSFTFDIRVDIGAQPHEILNNTVQASWTSLPSRSTALNSSGLIGVDGSATGMRNGALPNSANAINDYETSATAISTVPALTMSKDDLNPALLPEVGAHKNFEVVINLPEGTTNNLTVTDALNSAGLSYVLSHNASFDITYSFDNIASINGAAPTESAFIAFPADNTSVSAVWNIGTVVTLSEDDTVPTPSINPRIRINYYARINNDINTDSGDTLQNSATVRYSHGETSAVMSVTDNTPVVTVRESLLTVTKTASLITPAPISAGDIIQYVVSIPNSGNAMAYDVNIVDTLPLHLQLDVSFTPTATIAAVPVAGFIAAPAGAPVGPLIWGRANADTSLDIPIGATLVLTYRTVVQSGAQSNTNLSNSVLVDWTSLNGASIYERTGAGCPVIIAPDDYCTGPATSTVVVGDNNSFGKLVIADSYLPTNDATVRVGDTVTYQLSLNLQEGTTRTVSVQDVLPSGLAFFDILSINGDTTADYTSPLVGAGSNFSYSTITPLALPIASQTGALTFTFGDITNNPLGDPTTDSLLIVYRARVIENTLAHLPSISRINTATLRYVDGVGAPVVDPSRLQRSATMTVLQPVMTAPTKTDRSGRISPVSVNVTTDTMNFRVSSCNTTGLAPAYSLQMTDQLATQLDEASIAGPTNGAGQPDVYINGVIGIVGVDYNYTAPAVRGGSMLFQLMTPVNPAQCVDINYDIGFYNDFGPNQSWNNSVTVDEYWSLPLLSGQRYAALGPAIFTMFNTVPLALPTKVIVSPLNGEVTIGEEIIYRITLPDINAARYDIIINDILHASLEYISAAEVSGNGFVIIDNSTAPGNVSLAIDFIPANQQAIIELRVRVANNTVANAGVNFTNTASFLYSEFDGGPAILGGASTTPTSLTIVEPLSNINKTVANISNPGNPPNGGDILRYSLTFTASGVGASDNFSDVFDVSIIDNLSLGLAYQAASSTVNGAANTITNPVVIGDGITVAQNLNWSLASTTADIDITEGSTVTVTYDVLVLNSVLANQTLTNSAQAQWTGLDGINAFERNGTATPVVNDYFTATVTTSLTTPDTTTLNKSRASDTYNNLDANVRIGDLIEYELRIGTQEGQYNNVLLRDVLPQGLAFAGIIHVNGDTTTSFSSVAPFVHGDIVPVISGDPLTGPSTVTFIQGNLTNLGDSNNANDEFVIRYLARVVNEVHPQINNILLTNNAELVYSTGTGNVTRNASSNITVLQPMLTVSKSAAPAGGDTVLVANELVAYTVNITNSGTAPAYDLVLEDIIPMGMRNGTATITMISTTLVNAATSLSNIAPSYNAATGLAVWNFDNGVADAYTIAAGETLRIIYQVQTDTNLGAALILSNQALARLYYSFDDDAVPSVNSVIGVREIYGPSNIATTTLTTPSPGALLKENPVDTTVSVGEIFTYQITVPATPLSIALHDVRILDNLAASAADLTFISVSKISGSQPWSPANTGTISNLIIEDASIGIDIPAGEQVVIGITVQVADTPANVSGLTFNNTASYTYNQLPNNPATQLVGGASTTPDMIIVGPDSITLEKTGPANMIPTVPEQFRLNVHNIGSSPAWNLTIIDQLPNLAPVVGGMCNNAPNNIVAQIFQADGITPVSPVLIPGVDYVLNFVGEPSCVFTITLQSAAAALPENNRLIITYEAELDLDTLGNTTLTNIAGATEWFSANTPAARRYTRVITNGTVGTLDHEDAHSLDSELATLVVQKRVVNITTGQDPGSNAQPNDTLRYNILIQNISNVPVPNFSFIDELDALNTTAMFAAGSLNVITVPLGTDISNTNANGGAKGSGYVDIRNMFLGIAGSADDTVQIAFEVRLAPVIQNATVVLNQGHVRIISINFATDDPNINGADDPLIVGDEDPTQTLIASAPGFQVLKTSTDLTDDPAILLSGDTLRYTITVKNIGGENALNTFLRDQLPANTQYIGGSTTLNGNLVAEPIPGVLPLQSGILINAPENTTAGFMRADPSSTPSNVATIVFDVLINTNVLNGTIISNQGFITAVGANSGTIPEQPSDDPDTAVPNDPTRDIVGNQPLIDSQKTVSIVVDNGTIGVLDPGDVIRYTITINNTGTSLATAVSLMDDVPVNTTYIPDSVMLNGMPVDQPDAGISPLITGIAVSSSDLTPPLPTDGNGVISVGGIAVVTFDVRVNLGVAVGTVISNQGSVTSLELPVELTDADGIDSNGDQPTLIVVGNAQLLTIIKTVAVVGSNVALPGGQLEYRVRVTNISSVAANNVVITDNLDIPVAGQLTLIPGSALLNSLPAGISFTAPIITANYSAVYGDLMPGQTAELRFIATIDNALPMGATITNIGNVSWNSPTQTTSASVSIDVGGSPGVANISGALWHDANFDNIFDITERPLSNWNIDVYRGVQLLGTIIADPNGQYQISGILPNDAGGDSYELRFRNPGATFTTALLGLADSNFINELQRIHSITLSSGGNALNLNLPIDPNGVVFDSLMRAPIAGASLRLLNAASGNAVPDTCFDNTSQQGQVTLTEGFYKFDLNFSHIYCLASANYLIEVTPPPVGFNPLPSVAIPPQTDVNTAPLDVPSCPGSIADALPLPADYCEAQNSEFAPPLSIPPGSRGTNYYLHLSLGNTQIPQDSQIFNNHLPIDRDISNAVTISKTTPMVNVNRSQLVPYTITVTNTLPISLAASNIVDSFPAGFKYVEGSARLNDGVTESQLEPVRNGLQLIWSDIDLPINQAVTIKFLLIVGAAVEEGEYINRAQVMDTLTNAPASGIAMATVRVIPDPAFDCSDVIGKVFDDKNLNGYQDEAEEGLAGVRLLTARGLSVQSDAYGRFHVTCAVVANETRGSNFIMKLDERSLPSGYRVTTDNPKVQRATRGKMLKFNFGATIHRVVSLDIADGVFESKSSAMRTQWKPRLDLLIEKLQQAPSVLRISYLADVEESALVEDRLEEVKKTVIKKWQELNQYPLTIEKEIFWRRGGPAKPGEIQ